jgi:hypothetical protein
MRLPSQNPRSSSVLALKWSRCHVFSAMATPDLANNEKEMIISLSCMPVCHSKIFSNFSTLKTPKICKIFPLTYVENIYNADPALVKMSIFEIPKPLSKALERG